MPSDELIQDLKDRITKLEARIQQLEHSDVPKTNKGISESMRMILIGPPGAG